MRHKFRWEMSSRDFDDYLKDKNFKISFGNENAWCQEDFGQNSPYKNLLSRSNYDHSEDIVISRNVSNSNGEEEKESAEAIKKVNVVFKVGKQL